MTARLKAALLLAFALVRTLWRLLWGGGRDGLARFRENYAADGLTALSADEREQMRAFGRCIACGRCDRGDSERVLSSAGHYRSTMGLVLAASRSMPDFRAAVAGFEHLDEAALAAKERLCPTGVPLRAIARFVVSKADAARISVPASQGETRVPSSMPPSRERGVWD
jgi:hypothetical protein